MMEEIRKQINEVLESLGLPRAEFEVEHPKEESYGDYSSNVALKLKTQNAKVKSTTQKSKVDEYKSPRELAEAIRDELIKVNKVSEVIEKVEVAGPGFINISIKNEWFVNELARVLNDGDRYGKSDQLQGKKISVEYTDPNPFKEFHIGHLYSNSIGESVARIFEANGAKVWRADFFGDVGMHVAKAIWGLRQRMDNGLTIENLEEKSLKDRIKFLGEAYVAGAKAYEDPSAAGKAAREEIKRLNLLIFVASQEFWKEEKGWQARVNYRQHIKNLDEDELSQVKTLWATGRKWSLEYFETIYRRLGTKFDGYYPESLTGEWGYELVIEGLKTGVFKKSEGAIVYEGEKQGFHTRVFINKMGLPTYETKDIGNASMKFNDFAYDKSLVVTGNEINEYFKVVIAAMKRVNPELGEKTEHLGHGMVRLPEGKMSSRTGEVITGEWLLDEVKEKASQIISKSENRLSLKERGQITEMVAVGAVKYALLKNSIGRDVIFDFDKTVSLEGNSGPYIQYTYARTQSVIVKSKVKNQNSKVLIKTQNYEPLAINYKPNQEELAIMRWVYRFPEVVEKAGKECEPSQICTYLFELAQRFNTFYNKHSILGKADKGNSGNLGKQGDLVRDKYREGGQPRSSITSITQLPQSTRSFRLTLTASVGQIIHNGLELLGIKSPEQM